MGSGWQLRGYRGVSRAFPLVAGLVLRRRLARGKELPARWREKVGEASQARPEGPLVWMHAVGLGEVMALRGLIAAMQGVDPTLNFLVTSGTRTSAEVFCKALPVRTQHQFLPLDAPTYMARFLNHWRPDASIWAEQDLWPNAVCMTAERGVPLALVNARMNADAFARRQRFAGVFRDVLTRFSVVAAQDAGTAAHLAAFGADARVTGSLKAAAPDLPSDPAELARLRGPKSWVLASSHPADEAVALAAGVPGLIVAPRDVARAGEIAGVRRSDGAVPGGEGVYVADTYGELGLWYRMADAALIGGTFDDTEGHNPWEAAALGCAVLHGPRVANFAFDYSLLRSEAAAIEVTPESLAVVLSQDHSAMVARARALVAKARAQLVPLAEELVGMIAR